MEYICKRPYTYKLSTVKYVFDESCLDVGADLGPLVMLARGIVLPAFLL